MMQGLNEFLHMGGYAAYVWSAFGLSFLILLINFILPLKTEKKILRQLKKKLERSKQIRQNTFVINCYRFCSVC